MKNSDGQSFEPRLPTSAAFIISLEYSSVSIRTLAQASHHIQVPRQCPLLVAQTEHPTCPSPRCVESSNVAHSGNILHHASCCADNVSRLHLPSRRRQWRGDHAYWEHNIRSMPKARYMIPTASALHGAVGSITGV
jgi:hypothetical protein